MRKRLKRIIWWWQAQRAAIKFTRQVMEDFPDCHDVDGGDLQELALKTGVLVEIPGGFNPEEHDDEYGGAEPGDPWYRLHPGLS